MLNLNNPFMTETEVVASAKRGNAIAAAIRAGTYQSPRSMAGLANRGYNVEKWDADAMAAIAQLPGKIREFRQRYPNAAKWDTYGV